MQWWLAMPSTLANSSACDWECRGVLVAQEAGDAGALDGVDHPVNPDVAVEAEPLDRHLRAHGRLLGQAGAAADTRHLRWQVELVEHELERRPDPTDALADRRGRGAQLPVVLNP